MNSNLIRFFYFLSIIVILFFVDVHANNQKSNDKKYICLIENTNINLSNLGKRQEKKENVQSIINEIHNLIVNNVDTYNNPEVLEEIIHNNKKRIFKRQVEKDDKKDTVNEVIKQIHNLIINNKDTYKNPKILEELANNTNKKELKKRSNNKYRNQSKYINQISSSKDYTVISVLLSEQLLKEVETIPNIISCI
ncbi:hypothetical protein BCR36DRAFT_90245 [Piromyces finnis]|uniref:Uncharacterized protein n=1 Tax=Piromyces finnis TaxID=1754191 RepID=A0A1Y1VMA6_9FUNG|nr:hypothetical protein BCR36DRAFT_90245 [Piromyces finnis]|eukprot:ORX59276.1 hypothetical protein BCR36DRAFT_90245 [Piromyces finnis]